MGYAVYEHVFPNQKKYIGITSTDCDTRWGKGNGYKTQGKIWNAVKHYGWKNVKHNIIVDGLTAEQASVLEAYLIAELDTIENGYNTAIGGENISTTYLNQHVMEMIRESKQLDEKYGETQNPDDIVSFAEKGKTNKRIADVVNAADGLIDTFPEYKQYKGHAVFHDLHEARVDCYWWYMMKILAGDFKTITDGGAQPYWDAWRSQFFGHK